MAFGIDLTFKTPISLFFLDTIYAGMRVFVLIRVMMGAFPMYIPDNPVKKVVVDKDKEKDEERVPLLKK